MKILATIAALCLVGGTAATQQRERVFPFEYQTVRLDNGFTAYLIKAGAPGQIAYYSIVRTGSRDEVEEGKSGFAHFFEHMMFRGTEKYPNYDAITSAMGADRNGFTSSDMTVYYLVTASEYLEQLIDLEADRFQNLRYSEPDFRTEAGAVLGEKMQSIMSPFNYLYERLSELAFDKHTYRHTTIGFERDVRAMPEGYEYSKSFYRRFYRPENVVLVLVGDFDHAEAERLLRAHYGSWQPGYVTPDIPVEPPQQGERRETITYPGRTLPTLTLNYKAPAWSATDRSAVALEVLGDLAFGSTSPLYQQLVIDERIVQGLGGFFELQRDPALATVYAAVLEEANVPRVEQLIAETIAAAKTQLPDAQRLADTKRARRYGFLMGLETAGSVASATISFVVNTGGIEAIDDYYTTLEALTPEDIRDAARRYLVNEAKTVMTMMQATGGDQ
jgi:zinc protease